MDNTKIGLFIKKLRKEKNLTQKELADKLNITDRAISKWERGLGCPDISLLEQLAIALDVTILEILKGEKLNNNNLNEKDLIESMNLSKNNTLNNIKKITNYITFFIISLLSLFIIITNIKSIIFANKTFDFSNYYTKDKDYYITNKEKTTQELINETNTKIDLILINQGIYNGNDYSTIKTHINTLKQMLIEQDNQKYLNQINYNFYDLLNFYLSHQNIYTHHLDNKDLYKIILKYNPNLSDNLITYNYYEQSVHERYSYIYSYLEQPYHIKTRLPYNNYTPDPYNVIDTIYKKELILLNDILIAGDIK